ncbi:tryptophan halogenase family protein [Sphingomicrobium sediminis]|uniref:Tryptophan 7-halogenase n=1 Tax=Sphingomicrobium sediminis TaxID=2950949 RepID=A0A9X2J521_9SPHN|nr:tryptophan halogenase family protein [Sphingomicrobium sediminis]MCM8557802.1 tryptophan 7-halogenase [Sphingomicrobium sediminis]
MGIKRIVIVGGGTAGWMTAASLAQMMKLHPGLKITLVESEAIGTVGVGEATIPPFLDFNERLGIDEADLLSSVQGTFKLGIHFVNWERQGDSYFHPFGGYGYPIDGVGFHHVWIKARRDGDPRPLHRFNAETMAAMHRKFAKTPPNQRGDLPPINYAYHLDATAYAKYLRAYAEKLGVVRKEGRVVDHALHGESGFVRSITMDDGTEIEGDLFVDCSGFRGLLIEQALETGYEDWTHWLPCDRAVAIPSAGDNTVLPYTRATAHSAGWQWRVPLQRRNGNGHVYCSSFMEQDEATRILLENIDGEAQADPNHLRFVTGRRKKFWNKNVVAIGLAAGFMEPLESTSIHLINTGINKLMTIMSMDGITETQQDTFNRLTGTEYNRIRDFLILHYNATKRDDSEFWNYVRTMDVPDTLTEKIEMFKATGHIFREEDELFVETSWVAVMMGQGIMPGGPHVMTPSMNQDGVAREVGEIEKSIAYLVNEMPTHDQFLASYCPAR